MSLHKFAENKFAKMNGDLVPKERAIKLYKRAATQKEVKQPMKYFMTF